MADTERGRSGVAAATAAAGRRPAARRRPRAATAPGWAGRQAAERRGQDAAPSRPRRPKAPRPRRRAGQDRRRRRPLRPSDRPRAAPAEDGTASEGREGRADQGGGDQGGGDARRPRRRHAPRKAATKAAATKTTAAPRRRPRQSDRRTKSAAPPRRPPPRRPPRPPRPRPRRPRQGRRQEGAAPRPPAEGRRRREGRGQGDPGQGPGQGRARRSPAPPRPPRPRRRRPRPPRRQGGAPQGGAARAGGPRRRVALDRQGARRGPDRARGARPPGCAARSPPPRRASPTCCATPATAPATTRPTPAPRPSSASTRCRWPTTAATCCMQAERALQPHRRRHLRRLRVLRQPDRQGAAAGLPPCDPVRVMQAEGGAPLSGDEPTSDPRRPPATPRPRPGRRPGSRPTRVAVASGCAWSSARRRDRRPRPDQQADRRRQAGRPSSRSTARRLLTLTYTRNPGRPSASATGFTAGLHGGRGGVVVVILRTARRLYAWPGRSPSARCSAGRSATSSTGLSATPGLLRGHVVDWIQLPHFAGVQPRRLGDHAASAVGDGPAHRVAAAATLDGRPATTPSADAADARRRPSGRCRCPTASRASGSTPASPGCSGFSRTKAAELAAGGRGDRRRRAAGKSDRVQRRSLARGRAARRRRPRRQVVAEPVPGLRIVYDDDDIVVVDKPVGVAAHPSPGWTGPDRDRRAGRRRLPRLDQRRRRAAGHRAPARRRHQRADGGREVRARLHRAQAGVQGAHGREELPRARPGAPRPAARHRRRPDRPAPEHDYKWAVVADGKPSVTHYETLEAHPRGQPARDPARDRPHPPDPGAHGGAAPPVRRRPHLRRRPHARRPARA